MRLSPIRENRSSCSSPASSTETPSSSNKRRRLLLSVETTPTLTSEKKSEAKVLEQNCNLMQLIRCPICLDIYTGKIVECIACSNALCLECIEKYFQKKFKEVCPLCRDFPRPLRRNKPLERIVEALNHSVTPTPSHLSSSSASTFIACPIAKFGCKMKIHPDKLDDHLASYSLHHWDLIATHSAPQLEVADSIGIETCPEKLWSKSQLAAIEKLHQANPTIGECNQIQSNPAITQRQRLLQYLHAHSFFTDIVASASDEMTSISSTTPTIEA